jgi:hypothetical protein
MNFFGSSTVDTPASSPVVRRKIATWMLALLFLCGLGVQFLCANPADVPTASGGMGPCTADFTVVDASSKPVYNANIHVLVKYGFMSKRDTDLQVGTNSDGKARFDGLPVKLKKPPMQFTVSSGTLSKTVENDPAADCHPTFSITLGK